MKLIVANHWQQLTPEQAAALKSNLVHRMTSYDKHVEHYNKTINDDTNYEVGELFKALNGLLLLALQAINEHNETSEHKHRFYYIDEAGKPRNGSYKLGYWVTDDEYENIPEVFKTKSLLNQTREERDAYIMITRARISNLYTINNKFKINKYTLKDSLNNYKFINHIKSTIPDMTTSIFLKHLADLALLISLEKPITTDVKLIVEEITDMIDEISNIAKNSETETKIKLENYSKTQLDNSKQRVLTTQINDKGWWRQQMVDKPV
jgi:hypothetical protein